jgi:hypothetical protein
MQNPQVRLARASDTNDLIRLIRESHEEECAIPLRFDPSSVFNTILKAMSGNAVIGVIDGDHEIESACYLSACTPWYSESPLLDNLFFYTRPDYRRSQNSKALLTWARGQSERLNAPMQIEVPMSEAAKPKLALCERILGNDTTGTIFVYMPNPEQPTDVSDVEVRPAEASDESEVIATIRQLAVEDGSHPPSDDIAIPFIRNALNGDGIIGIIRNQGDIEALLFLKIAHPWYSKDLYLDEYLLYCKPQYRKSKDARSLVQFAKRQSDRLALPLRIGITSKNDNVRKRQLYQRMLGNPTNLFFLYRPEAA